MQTPDSWTHRARRGLVEFVAIFLGVTLSFVADDWREDLADGRQVELVLAGIRSDLEQDLEQLDWLIRADSAAVEGGLWLHANWERSRLPGDSLESALAVLHQGAPYSPVRSEYESAKSAGRLQLITNAGLRTAITELYERGQPHNVSVGHMSIDFDFELWRELRPYVRFATEFGALPLIPQITLDVPWSEASSNAVLRNSLVYDFSFRRMHLSQVRELRGSTERLIELIAEELAG
jgi:uncharacterized protein DUF6090